MILGYLIVGALAGLIAALAGLLMGGSGTWALGLYGAVGSCTVLAMAVLAARSKSG